VLPNIKTTFVAKMNISQQLNESVATLCCLCPGVSAVAAGKETGELGEFRNKLLTFLEVSRSYEPERLISDFPFDGELSSQVRVITL